MSKITVINDVTHGVLNWKTLSIGTVFTGQVCEPGPEELFIICCGPKLFSLADPNRTWSSDFPVINFKEVDILITVKAKN